MIAELHGCSDCRRRTLGDDPIDVSTIDFGTPELPAIDTSLLPPTSFDIPNTIDLSSEPIFLQFPPTDLGIDAVLPTTLPPADIAAASIPLMPTPVPVSIPSSGGSSLATDIAAGSAAAGGLLATLKQIFTGKPTPPPGYTYNAQGQLVPMPVVAGVPQTGVGASLSQIESWLSTNWKWLAIAGGGVVAVSMFSGGGKRRRNPESGEFVCPHCGEKFTAAQIEAGKFRKHMAEHRGKRTK